MLKIVLGMPSTMGQAGAFDVLEEVTRLQAVGLPEDRPRGRDVHKSRGGCACNIVNATQVAQALPEVPQENEGDREPTLVDKLAQVSLVLALRAYAGGQAVSACGCVV